MNGPFFQVTVLLSFTYLWCWVVYRYLLQNSDWLHEELDKSGDDDYVIIDCPGQIELYSHLPIMRDLVKEIEGWGFRCVCVYLIDALFVLDPSKFVSGCMLSLSCMMQLELPQINVVTKCDLVDKAAVQAILDLESTSNFLVDKNVPKNMRRLTSAISEVVDDYMMVGFVMLDPTEEESIELVVQHTDHAIQYGEDLEPKDLDEREENEDCGA
jgi:GTPase SAR1 family protein